VSRSPDRAENASPDDPGTSTWQWIAVGLLLLCWIAEASMCADRGF
jgi:hypothetical protein